LGYGLNKTQENLKKFLETSEPFDVYVLKQISVGMWTWMVGDCFKKVMVSAREMTCTLLSLFHLEAKEHNWSFWRHWNLVLFSKITTTSNTAHYHFLKATFYMISGNPDGWINTEIIILAISFLKMHTISGPLNWETRKVLVKFMGCTV
jgi:hypothetical protein